MAAPARYLSNSGKKSVEEMAVLYSDAFLTIKKTGMNIQKKGLVLIMRTNLPGLFGMGNDLVYRLVHFLKVGINF